MNLTLGINNHMDEIAEDIHHLGFDRDQVNTFLKDNSYNFEEFNTLPITDQVNDVVEVLKIAGDNPENVYPHSQNEKVNLFDDTFFVENKLNSITPLISS